MTATLREIVLSKDKQGGEFQDMTTDGMVAVLRAFDVADEVVARRQWFEAERQRKIQELRAGKAERLKREGERRMRGGRK